jgi:NitT/TauT family transport system permease protein/sulfonate transport system permease protein
MSAPARSLSLNTRRVLAANVFVVVMLVVWWLAAERMPDYVLPGPLLVARKTIAFFTTINLAAHIVASIYHVGAALLIAFLLGTGLAVVSRYVPVTRLLIGRLAAFLNSFSSIGWALLAILWFGLNNTTVIFVIGIIILPVFIINMQAALDQVDDELIEMAHSYTRTWSRAFVSVVLPSLYPFMLATVRLSFGIAWKVALTAELFGGNSGFGYVVNMARQSIDTPEIFTVIAIMIVLSFLTDRFLLMPLQRSVSRHYADE